MIRAENLTKSFGNVRAVDDVSLTVEEGVFFTLLGPSGCGKTTILRSIAGLERPDSGTIQLGDKVVHSKNLSVPTHARNIGMVFQNYAVWPHMNVFDNVAFPLRVGGVQGKLSSTEVKSRVKKALKVVGLQGLEDRMSTKLSGGQQQRLSFARALVREPEVLLLDEPLSNLDAKLRERMRRDLSLLHYQLGITSLFVTHDQIEALSMSDRIAVMRAGRIIQEGSPAEVYHEPIDEFVATFIGSTNLIQGKVTSIGDGVVTVDTDLGPLSGLTRESPSLGDTMTVAIRPEEINLSEAHGDISAEKTDSVNCLDGKVIVSLFGGSFIEYEVEVEGVLLSVRTGSRHALTRGSHVTVELPVGATRVFSSLSEAERRQAFYDVDEESVMEVRSSKPSAESR